MKRRAALAAVVCGVVIVFSGCAQVAGLVPDAPAGPASDGAVSAAAPAADSPASAPGAGAERAVYRVQVQAPDALRVLLAGYLDLARFQNAPTTEGINSAELDRLASAAPAQARALLETEGYFNADVQVQRSAGADGTPVLWVEVRPGPRATVQSLSVTTIGALHSAAESGDTDALAQRTAWLKAWSLKTGEPFRQSSWATAKTTALAQLRAEGYPLATWDRTAASVDTQTQRVTLDVVADSGPLFRLGAIRVEGLSRYEESAVRRLSSFGAGQPYSEKLLLDYQERLQRIGLFEGASVELEADPATASAAPVVVRVKELPLQLATIGVGISANTGPRLTLEHVHRRPFGWQWVARNKFELGADLKVWTGELLSHPLEGQYRNLVAGQAERLRSGEELRTSWSARVGRTQDTQRIERLYFAELVHARVDNQIGRNSSEAVSGNYHWTYRDLDSALLPTDGFTLSAQAAGGQARGRKSGQFTGPASDSGPFGRVYGRLTWYRPLGASWYATARVEAGQVLARDTLVVPDTLLFRVGGDSSVRGYAYRALGPIVDGALASGRMLFTSSLEVARPLSQSLPAFWWAAFIDAGNAANRWSELDPAVGYGVGLRWRSPVGPLRLDLAYGKEVRRARLHLSVGIAF
jgi:translocation and assembly module TamA